MGRLNDTFFNITGNPNRIPVIRYNCYPNIAVTEKNKEYAYILMEDLAASESEMTSVHQYLFQSWNIDNKYITVRGVIKNISQVEIHHFNIIGQLITFLGEKASCKTVVQNSNVVWNGSMINYTTDIKEILKINMEAENGAANSYLQQSKKIKDPLISKMLYRLSLDEQLHFDIFKSFLTQI